MASTYKCISYRDCCRAMHAYMSYICYMYYDATRINFVTWELSRVTDVHLNDVGVGESCQ